MSQYVHALTASEAQMAIDHLDSLIEGLVQKKIHLEHVKTEASRQATENEEPRVFYSYDTRGPSEDMLAMVSGMRLGRIRRIERFIQVDPIWAVRVLKTATNPDDCFRFTDSEETAKGVLALHSLI